MTYRMCLILGLIAGLGAAPAGVRATDFSAGQRTAPVRASVQDMTLQRAATTSTTPEYWQPSEPVAASDVRFKKPEIPANRVHATDMSNAALAQHAVTTASATNAIAKPNRLPALSVPSAKSPSSARLEITDTRGRPTSTPEKQPAMLSDLLAPAVEQQKVSQLALETAKPAVPDQTLQPATANFRIAEAKATPESALPAATDDVDRPGMLFDAEQRVEQILNDNYVLPANQEEPLPGAPNADPLRGANGDDQSDRGFEPYKGDALYGECCPPQPRLFWVAGVEATFLSPDINSTGRASWAVVDVDENRDEVYATEDVDSVYLTPRIWIGVQGCAWGANLRYWHLNASENYFDPSIGQAGTWDDFDCGRPNVGFFSMSRLEAYTIDLELTRRFCLHDCQMQGSVGVRHADVQFAESITGTALATDANLFGYAEAERYTRGTGLVFGLYGRKPVFPCSCVHWYYNLRWSALWGPTRTAVETGATVLGTGANAGSVNGAYTCVDDNLFIGEIQLGLEWNYALQCVPANAFFRAGVEYQRWTGGIGYSEAGSFAGIEVDDDFAQRGSTFASAAAPELDLIGLTLGTGLTW